MHAIKKYTMRCLIVLLNCLLVVVSFVHTKEWCRAPLESGKPEYGVCLPEGLSEAKYTIEILPVVSPGIHLLNDVSITIVGEDGKVTKPIPIASESIGTQKRVSANRIDVGSPVYVYATLKGQKPWKCQKITVWKDFKYWVFDCVGLLDVKTPVATYVLSGNKLYEAIVQTGNDPQAGTNGGIELTLLGKEKQGNPKMLKQGFLSASQRRIQFRAADVGELEGIVLKNTADNDPWYCDFVRIKADDGRLYPFTVKRWIGAPYDASVTVHLKLDVETTAQDIECHTRAADLFNKIPEELHAFKVRCPMNCQASEFAHVEGSSIHPATSSLCAAAIVDGVLSASGGEVVVSVVGELPFYSGLISTTGVSAAEYVPSADKPVFSFYLYRSDSIDDIEKDVRVVDVYGKLSAIGRLEVRKNGSWGTVCKKGAFQEFTVDSAKKACQELGYLHGIYLEDNCNNVNGQNVCASKGYPVAAAGIMCRGTERSLSECSFEPPNDFCQNHINDVAVQCTNNPPDREPLPGTLRIVDSSGAPSQTGVGRLEFYADGFGTVCRDNWTKESERVACLEMGYSGLLSGGKSDEMCSDIQGVNYCASSKEKIAAVNVSCLGNERSLRQCPHQTNEPDCIHEEDVVVACEGNGDPSGIGLFKKEDPPKITRRKVAPKIKLNCGDRLLTKPEIKGPAGSMFIATCPEGCSQDPGSLRGTYVYTEDSPICKAAIHSGAIEANGGDIVVVIGHKQDSFVASERHGIISEHSGPYAKTFLVSKAVSSVRAAISAEKSKYAGTCKNYTTALPVFLQLNGKTATAQIPAIKDLFHWSAPAEWPGFRGKDYVESKNIPGGDLISGFRDFTITARVKPTGGENQWRCIFAHSYCDGFELAINKENELVFEQPCHNENFISTGYHPKPSEWFHVAITYSQPFKAVAVFVNGQKVAYEKSSMEFNLKNYLVIGKASEIDAEYFYGEITSVRAFPYVLSPQQIVQVMNEAAMGNVEYSPAVKGQRRTEDGRVCISPCTSEQPGVSFHIGEYPTNPSIKLSCHDTATTPDFNGSAGSKFRIACPPGCSHEDANVKGNKVYSEDTPICKAAIHAGVLNRNGGEAIITIHNGLSEYEGIRGHYGIVSIKETIPGIKSFSISEAPILLRLSCSDNGTFILKLGIGEKELVECPSGCDKFFDAKVFGTKLYSPTSAVCVAAIHSGTMTSQGGQVEIEAGPEHEHFKGSTQNGRTSEDSGYYLRSFTCVRSSKNKA